VIERGPLQPVVRRVAGKVETERAAGGADSQEPSPAASHRSTMGHRTTGAAATMCALSRLAPVATGSRKTAADGAAAVALRLGDTRRNERLGSFPYV